MHRAVSHVRVLRWRRYPRHWKGQTPIRIVIDRNKRLSKTLTIFDDTAETIIISEENINFYKAISEQICAILHSNNINSVIIEGGRQTLQTFIDEDFWDEARVFTGNITYNKGVKAPKLNGKLISEQSFLNDYLKIYLND